MDLLTRLERKFGRYALSNLSLYIVITYAAGYILSLTSSGLLSYLTLEPYYILRGQVWRLVSWLLIPPGRLNIFTIITLLFYYSVGNTLERTWGAFRYNVYIFSGILMTIVGSFLLYFLYGGRVLMGAAFSTYYISMSIFLAFAATYPNMQVFLYGLIPLKVKWLGYLDGILLIVELIQGGWASRVVIICSLLNFIVFFLSSGSMRRFRPGEIRRKQQFRKAVHRSQVRPDGTVTKHKCAICGRTEKDGDHLEFRFCSKCNGNYEYCQDHLFTHTHVK
ncbi:MAG TPA: hypothetical protein IAA57_09620 [Candidatus Pullilachnospira intestinigallinarum]|nr:hypothetical protein [Candidatus Pullilachnospira intestinigallinarum]